MQIIVKGKNVEVTDALRGYAEKRIGKVQKYFDHIMSADVVLSTERNWHIVEVTLFADGVKLRGEERTADMYSSIDRVIEKLEKQMKKHKEKMVQRPRTVAAKEAAMPVATASEREGPAPRIIRMKKVPIKPLTEEEACTELDSQGQEFLVFENSVSGKVNVVYQRNDGNYGLIEPGY
ncbi:MAG: ribosome-associated translation inhibitor RaiA [Armatimonadetes bacterium]|nr:ribosome-associated translation inhibitor RaiA [Armatimonadota bacterium]